MIPNPMLDELVKGIAAGFDRLGDTRDEIERRIRQIVTLKLSEFDVVTREELEVQQALLAQATRRIAELEKRLKALEEGGSQA
ncbi:MAG: 3-octaprenyl-4-hydroxybenzoate carboxy-lyase [Alphaproteobacteria bacterium CG_4_10_14_0_2_um_filter_63_37]|nr:MAG: hypothetical protein AUJ55_00420 [Proteobacteria bacterium CG1_02_64_396]PJA24017.1 MAG: 3-octaprenyl-4-hydroxybenzoate carboxy-lyase [Alphaproteobacteria bacterium CG_4_10_14_0_2_um_filter_63_37]